MKLTDLFRKTPELPPIRVTVRLSCGVSYTLTAPSAADALEFVEKMTDPRAGFTTIPADLDDHSTQRKINRAHVTCVFVEGLPPTDEQGSES